MTTKKLAAGAGMLGITGITYLMYKGN